MSAPDVGYAAARCTLQQTRSGSKGQPPLVPGRAHAPLSFLRSQVFDRSSTDIACGDAGSVLMGEVGINEVVVAYVEWPELHYVDGSKGICLPSCLLLQVRDSHCVSWHQGLC